MEIQIPPMLQFWRSLGVFNQVSRRHLLKTCKGHLLSFEELSTLLCQIEACINCRPMFPLSSDPVDMRALTPGHFLIREPLLEIPEKNGIAKENHVMLVTSDELTYNILNTQETDENIRNVKKLLTSSKTSEFILNDNELFKISVSYTPHLSVTEYAILSRLPIQTETLEHRIGTFCKQEVQRTDARILSKSIRRTFTEDWLKFQKAFNEINYLTVPRWVILTADNTVELHGFADASSLAYAAAIYCRQKHNGNIKVQLPVSKTKVTCVKQVSIPRLEMCGAHLLSKLFKSALRTLKHYTFDVFAWTDSKTVLSWLSSHPCKWKTFVVNRTSEIIKVLPTKHWRHEHPKEKQEDIASRGSSFSSSQINTTSLTFSETKTAEETIIRWVQGIHFQEEIQSIKKQISLPPKSPLRSLHQFIGEHGLVQVGGRLRNSQLRFNSEHPIILPSQHTISKLLIKEQHITHLHAGPTLLAHVHRQSHWIVRS
ncbi:putative gag-pol protein [Trichonephila clavipes]|uniref:Putative gag-pol protein n=1 Tax=Trichonephila clavipes TaxID=2585209 RepID=A0A8X6VP48_TRICX|nr:putative gag-pol protein [Trichonephila clavipes]